MKPWRVLVFPGGTEIGLEINSALRDCKEVELFSAGTSQSNHAPFVFNIYDHVPDISQGNWLTELKGVLRKREIDYIIPAHDDVVLALARVADDVLPARVISSPVQTCEIARSKLQTYLRFRELLPVPKVYPGAEAVSSFPVFVKPERGQGSQHASKIDSPEELAVALRSRNDLIILEYLPGEEYTIDCFSDRDRGLLFCSGRLRQRVRAGISVATQGVESGEFRKIAEIIAASLPFHGAWFFQLKRSSVGVLTLLEIAPRIAGAMALSRTCGVNFPLLSIYENARAPIELRVTSFSARLDRAFVNRYYAAIEVKTIYVDLDDTLILRGKVNLALIRLIYQQINRGCRIVLVTRHGADLQRTLLQHRLSGIFDQIVHLKTGEPKSSAIDDTSGAIFIDDSFTERREVSLRTGIPTFDNSMIELLQDYRA